MLPLSVKINDIADDQVMSLKVKNYPIIWEAPFPISVNRKTRPYPSWELLEKLDL